MKTTFVDFAKIWLAPSNAARGGAEPAEPEQLEDWGPARRAAFRFAFAYLSLYNVSGPLALLSQVPLIGALADAYERLWNALVFGVAKHALGLPGPLSVEMTGAGDTTFAYVELLCQVTLAAAAALGWARLDRRRQSYARLHGALRVYLRYTIALAMMVYGSGKVIQSQFPAPSLEHLSRTYGESTPMGLLWTFMGYSAAYSAFGGASEMLGGLLLVFRRTATLGALVVSAVMANVVMLNFCYDVPVKLYSAHLLLMALVLLAPDARRLADVLVLGRAAAALPARVPFRARWLEWARRVGKPIVIVGVVAACLAFSVSSYRARGPSAPKPEIYGMYRVESFERQGAPAPAALAPWHTLAVGRIAIVLRREDGAGRSLRVKIDPEKKRINLTPLPDGLRPNGEGPVDLAYERPDPDHLRLEGEFEGERVAVVLARVPEPPSLLMSRGFHWVNEVPYNR